MAGTALSVRSGASDTDEDRDRENPAQSTREDPSAVTRPGKRQRINVISSSEEDIEEDRSTYGRASALGPISV